METKLSSTKRAGGMFLAVVLSLFLAQRAQAVVSTGEYYIVNDFWGKLLTANGDSAPRLMAYDSDNDAAFIFVAQASGTSGYVKLKHKSTGLYLAASTSNTWSVLLSSNGSGDQYLWALDQLFDTKIVNKKNTGKHLGTDFYSGSTYYWDATEVPIYYNKGDGALSWFSVIPSNGNGFEASRQVAKTTTFTNEYGVTEQDDYCVSEPVDVNGYDYHIKSPTPFEGTGCVNLSSENSWLVFDAVRPSKVISTYLSNVTINGAAAVNGTNCRVEIWMRGAVVIPLPSAPFIATTDNGTFTLELGNTSDLGENSNKMRSFTLKRGFMATVATGTSGGDYSRVYVADHADLTVTLPTPLDKRVSSVYVRNWHYTSKAGYCSTNSDLLYATTVCGGSWAWNWDAGSTTSTDVEYIPIKSHLYWPSDGNFYKAGSTAMMMFNEPEHSEQHNSEKCSCGGTIGEWTAYRQTPKFNATGLRIGSPSATDLSYIKNYLDYCDNMKQRCDFSCTHGYWITEDWTSNLNTLKGYGRPIWITEWEHGASWISGSNPNSVNDARAKVFDILEILEYNNYVERYSYYEFDTGGTNGWMREMFWENTASKGNAYVGQVYSRIKPHFGYDASIQPVPNWWAPSVSTPAITDCKLADGKYTLTISNGNGDATETFVIMRQNGNSWETIYTITDRSEFEATSMKITVPSGIEAGDVIKVVITTLFNDGTQVESDTFNIPDYRALSALQNLEFNEGTFVSQNIRTYAKDITNSEVSGLQDVTGWVIPSNGDARAAGQLAWGTSYFLGAAGYTAPDTNSEGTSTGGALALNAVWTATTQYVQNVYMEAGTYTITIPVYNKTGGTTAVTKNLFGFIADDGTEYLATEKTWTANTWTTMTVSFVLNVDTYGKLSMGYTAANKGSSDMPHLFADYVRIDYSHELPSLAALDELQNLKFNKGTFTTDNLTIGGSDEQKEVTGWTVEATGGTYHSGAQLAYGSGLTLGASGSSYQIPEEGTDKDPTGGALALLAAWTAQVQYTQDITLPAGTYTLNIPVYNGGGETAISKNLCGFIADAGTEYLATATNFTVGEWTMQTVKFTLMAETSGKLSLGYKSDNKTSANMPHLFADYIQIVCGNKQWPSFLKGDVNGDGVVDEYDAQALVNYLIGRPDSDFIEANADVTGNGDITIADVTALVNIIVTE